MTYNAANLGGNIYVDNLIGCAVDVGAVVLVTGMLKVLSRRNAIASLFGAVACFAVLSPFVKQGKLYRLISGLVNRASGTQTV